MAACTDRQLTQAQLTASYDQQRTGVVRAIRPFSGSPTIENLIDYVNRELGPAVRQSRDKVNEVFKQVADNAPSANPLAYYFSETTTNADPTVGRMRLNQAVQNTATVVRCSQTNGRQQDVTPWLDVMSGGPTSPLGVLTMVDAINPSRFLRFDLNTMVDQGAYWDLGVTIVESSTASPFVDGEPVVIGFIAGVSAAGSTIPVGSLSPVANDTFLGNVSGASAAPAAVNLSTLAGAGLNFAAHTLDVNGSTSVTITSDQVQRAALTGDVTAGANSNATTIANGVVTNAKLATMAADTVKANVTAVTAAPTDHPLATLAGASLDYAAGVINYVGSTTNVNLTALTGAQGVLDISTLECGGSLTIQTVSADYTIAGFTAKTDGYWFWLIDRRTSGTTLGSLLEDSGSTTTSIRNPKVSALAFPAGARAAIYYYNGRHRVLPSPDLFAGLANTFTAANTFSSTVALGASVAFTGSISPTALSADQNNYTPTGWSTANLVRLSTNSATTRQISGAAAGASGELKWLVNIGPGTVTLLSEDAGSSAANRFVLTSGTTFGIVVNGVLGILYDGTSSRWRPTIPNLII